MTFFKLCALDSDNVIPFVSGAIKIDTNNPKTENPTPTKTVEAIPYLSKKIGKPKVVMTVPIRLNAIAAPTADARISVGNNSFG